MKIKLLVYIVFICILNISFGLDVKNKSYSKLTNTLQQHKLNHNLIRLLKDINKKDQKYRKKLSVIGKKYGWKSKRVNELSVKMKKQDNINLKKIKKILDTKGWLGTSIIGAEGSSTLFLVIQHSDLKTQMKYLPMLESAVLNGQASPQDLALMQDRVNLGNGKKQNYGSQLTLDSKTGKFKVLPLIDPKNVNKRRAKVGLEPIEKYLKCFTT